MVENMDFENLKFELEQDNYYHFALYRGKPRPWASTPTLLILTLSRMTLSKVSFSDILRNDYLDHLDTFGEIFDFDTFKNDTFENDTFESV